MAAATIRHHGKHIQTSSLVLGFNRSCTPEQRSVRNEQRSLREKELPPFGLR